MLEESRLWTRAGQEPTTTELLSDPIALLLMRADKLKRELGVNLLYPTYCEGLRALLAAP